MKKVLAGISVALLLLVTAFFALNYYIYWEKQGSGSPVPSETTGAGAPTFTWTYASSSKDDIPYSTISLAAEYPDGSVQAREIDTVVGDCNEYAEADTDTYENSTMIICYYAGLGHYFKIVEADGTYLVQRKTFEEASPDYTPPIESFKTILRF